MDLVDLLVAVPIAVLALYVWRRAPRSDLARESRRKSGSRHDGH